MNNLPEVEEWNYISTFYFLVKNCRKYVNLCEKVAFIALKDTKELSSRDKNKQTATKEKQTGGLTLRKIGVVVFAYYECPLSAIGDYHKASQ